MSLQTKRFADLSAAPPAGAVGPTDTPHDLGRAPTTCEFGGRTVLLDRNDPARELMVLPKGLELPVFAVARAARELLLSNHKPAHPWRRRKTILPADEFAHLGSPRQAVPMLCPLLIDRQPAIDDAVAAPDTAWLRAQ